MLTNVSQMCQRVYHAEQKDQSSRDFVEVDVVVQRQQHVQAEFAKFRYRVSEK